MSAGQPTTANDRTVLSAGDALPDEPSPPNVSGRVVNRDRAEANPTSAANVTLDRKTTCGVNSGKLTCDCGFTADCHKRTQARHPRRQQIHAFNHPVFVDDPDDCSTMFVGADTSGNLLEVGVIDSVDHTDHHPRHAGTTEVPQVIPMPRTAQEILDNADELAARFEHAEPDDLRDATALRVVREAFLARAETERTLRDAVVRARHDGHSWSSIGAMVGTSGEAARQRYGQAVNAE